MLGNITRYHRGGHVLYRFSDRAWSFQQQFLTTCSGAVLRPSSSLLKHFTVLPATCFKTPVQQTTNNQTTHTAINNNTLPAEIWAFLLATQTQLHCAFHKRSGLIIWTVSFTTLTLRMRDLLLVLAILQALQRIVDGPAVSFGLLQMMVTQLAMTKSMEHIVKLMRSSPVRMGQRRRHNPVT